jgi:c-di-GMP-related signal transduction protein
MDQDLANNSLEYRLEKWLNGLRDEEEGARKWISSLQHTLLFSSREGLKKVPYFLL